MRILPSGIVSLPPSVRKHRTTELEESSSRVVKFPPSALLPPTRNPLNLYVLRTGPVNAGCGCAHGRIAAVLRR